MANTLGNYNMLLYASETLIHLENALGMAARVHRGYERERASVNVGDTITITSPSTFTAEDPISVAQDLDPKTVNIVVDKNPGVAYKLSDLELAYTGEKIITDHIRPVAYAVANKIDQYLVELYKDVPWLFDYGAATDHTIITGAKSVAFNNAVPVDDLGNMHMMVDGTLQMHFENSNVFHNAQTTGPGQNQTLFRGGLGTRFGIEVFANQNATNSATHIPGTANQAAGDSVGAVNMAGTLLKGATSVVLDGFTGSETIAKGDTFTIAGNTQRYAATAALTLSTGAGTLNFTPPAVQVYPDSAVVTFTKQPDAGSVQQLQFHQNAFALAMAPLPQNLPGIEVATASDPITGLSLRARRWSTGLPAETWVAVDALLGVKTLVPDLAIRAFT